MKPIEQLKALITDMSSVFAPVLMTELLKLIDEIESVKPVVVIHVEGGCLTGVTASCEMAAILADYDVNDGESKTTPYGSEARIVNASVDVCPEEIAAWVALAED
jgi:uncharacterized protein (DUF779 family)